MLARLGCSVTTASDGQNALDQLKQGAASGKADEEFDLSAVQADVRALLRARSLGIIHATAAVAAA